MAFMRPVVHWRKRLLPLIGLLLVPLQTSVASESLASRLSIRFEKLKSEIERIDKELHSLPNIPKDDSGGMDAYARYYASIANRPNLEVDSTIRFTWDDPTTVDFIALMPARKYTSYGLDPEYGFPEDYEISLFNSSGEIVRLVADVRSTSATPSGRGLPFVHQLDEPVNASGVELRVKRLRPAIAGGPGIHFFALSEIFCFSGERNVMRDAKISFNYDENTNASPYWSPDFMIDEITPLGLPEKPLPDGDRRTEIGWISNGKALDTAPIWVTIDLGSEQAIDGVRMFPSIRPSLLTFAGFGMPRSYQIEVSPTGDPDSFQTIVPPGETDLPNPGSNPVTDRFPETRARFIRIRPDKLWKPFQHYPAFLSFSEIQILKGEENLAVGAEVITSETPDPFAAQGKYFWSPQSLTDDHGPTGQLIARKEWLELLGKRRALETTRADFLKEQSDIVAGWQKGSATTLIIAGVAGLLAIIVLPIRFRRRERRKIRMIRDRIAGDLHDDVGSNLGSIQLLAGSALSKPDHKDELKLINQVAAETVTSVRDIVWLLRPRAEARVSTISHLRESASFLLESLDWTLQSDLEDFELSDTDGRNLVLFFREALHNVARHSRAQRVSIRINEKAKDLVLEIEDDGCGIPPEKLVKEGTLRALKQRSKNLNGQLHIDSTPEKGTLLRLSFTPQPIRGKRSLRYPFLNRNE
jgi:signal transduction histidine kinase